MLPFVIKIIIPALTILLAVCCFAQRGAPVDVARDKPDKSERTGIEGTLIVLNKAEASVSLIDLQTGTVAKRIEVGDGPHEVAVTSDGRTAVVCNYGQKVPGNTLTVIDLLKQTVVRTIELGEYHRPHGIVFLPGAERVAVTCEHEQNVLVVNLRTGAIEKVIPTEAQISHMIVVTPDAKRAFVTNIYSHSVTVLDLEKGERITEIPTGQGAEGIDIKPDGSEVWVTNRADNTISVIDPESLEIIATLECPEFPIRVKFTPSGEIALVSNARSGDVVVFNAKTRSELTRIDMDEQPVEDDTDRLFAGAFEGSPVPVGILMHPSGTYAFVANTQADIITVIDLVKIKIVGRLVAGQEPDGLAYSPITLSQTTTPAPGR